MVPSLQRPQAIIGGVFALEEPNAEILQSRKWPFQQPNVLHLANGRGAFWLLANRLRPKIVWLPSYLCSSIIDGFLAAKVAVRFFPVGRDLRCESDSWLQHVEPGHMVLRIHYFGFPNLDPVFQEAIAQGACLVDDAAQALLSDGLGDGAEFVVFSPRKFVGVPDGGCLVMNHSTLFNSSELPTAPEAWWQESLSAITLRQSFDRGDNNRSWFSRYQAAETLAPAKAYAMSEMTHRLLTRGIDFDAIATRRRDNFRALLEYLADVAIFHDLPDGVVPLGFPIRVRQRDAIRQFLFERHIYPPVHWPLKTNVCIVSDSFKASHRLANEIMTLPCDQRYDGGEMERMSAALREALLIYR